MFNWDELLFNPNLLTQPQPVVAPGGWTPRLEPVNFSPQPTPSQPTVQPSWAAPNLEPALNPRVPFSPVAAENYDPFKAFAADVKEPKKPNLGLMGESWGTLKPDDQKKWLDDQFAAYETGQQRIKNLEGLIAASPSPVAQRALQSQLNATRSTLPDLAKLNEMRAGTAPLPLKTGLRAGAENAVQGFSGAVLGIPEFAGIVKGYLGDEKVDDNTLLKWAQDAKLKVNQLFPGDAARQEDFSQKLANGLGQLGAFYGGGAVTALLKAGPKAVAAVVTAMGASASGSQGFEEATAELKKAQEAAKAAGDTAQVSELDRILKTFGYAAVGTTEALPIVSTFARVAAPTTRIGARVAGAFEGALEEGAQEAASQLAQNAITGQTTDPNRPLGEGVAESAAIGAVLGGGAGGAFAGKPVPGVEEVNPSVEAPFAGPMEMKPGESLSFIDLIPDENGEYSVDGGQRALNAPVAALPSPEGPAAATVAPDLPPTAPAGSSSASAPITPPPGTSFFDAGSYDAALKGKELGKDEYYHGGSYKGGQSDGVVYLTKNPNFADTYVTMAKERGIEGADRQRLSVPLQAVAPMDAVERAATAAGIDTASSTPASWFDKELHGDQAVKLLTQSLKKAGFDHAVLPDVSYGGGMQEDVTVAFGPNAKTAVQDAAVKGKAAGPDMTRRGFLKGLGAAAGAAAVASTGLPKSVGQLASPPQAAATPVAAAARPAWRPWSEITNQYQYRPLTAQTLDPKRYEKLAKFVTKNIGGNVDLGQQLAEGKIQEVVFEGRPVGYNIDIAFPHYATPDFRLQNHPFKLYEKAFNPLPYPKAIEAQKQSEAPKAEKPTLPEQPFKAVGGKPGDVTRAIEISPQLNADQVEQQSKLLLNAGRTVQLPDALTEPYFRAINALGSMIPENIPANVLVEVRPSGVTENGKPLINAVFRTAAGAEQMVQGTWEELTDVRAFYMPAGGGAAHGLFLLPLDPSQSGSDRLGGVLWHEILHALRREGHLPARDWNRLLGHATDLDILGQRYQSFAQATRDPYAKDYEPNGTIRELYAEFNEGRPDFDEAMAQEAVAHMLEQYSHGALDAQAMAPIQDVLDNIKNGAYAQPVTGAEAGPIDQARQGVKLPEGVVRVYHGTVRPDFERFDTSKSEHGGDAYFTENPELANEFAGGKYPESLENPPYSLPYNSARRVIPADMDVTGFKRVKFGSWLLGPYEWTRDDGAKLQKAVDQAKAEGYKGLVAEGITDQKVKGSQYITWTPDTVKHAFTQKPLYALFGKWGKGEARTGEPAPELPKDLEYLNKSTTEEWATAKYSKPLFAIENIPGTVSYEISKTVLQNSLTETTKWMNEKNIGGTKNELYDLTFKKIFIKNMMKMGQDYLQKEGSGPKEAGIYLTAAAAGLMPGSGQPVLAKAPLTETGPAKPAGPKPATDYTKKEIDALNDADWATAKYLNPYYAVDSLTGFAHETATKLLKEAAKSSEPLKKKFLFSIITVANVWSTWAEGSKNKQASDQLLAAAQLLLPGSIQKPAAQSGTTVTTSYGHKLAEKNKAAFKAEINKTLDQLVAVGEKKTSKPFTVQQASEYADAQHPGAGVTIDNLMRWNEGADTDPKLLAIAIEELLADPETSGIDISEDPLQLAVLQDIVAMLEGQKSPPEPTTAQTSITVDQALEYAKTQDTDAYFALYDLVKGAFKGTDSAKLDPAQVADALIDHLENQDEPITAADFKSDTVLNDIAGMLYGHKSLPEPEPAAVEAAGKIIMAAFGDYYWFQEAKNNAAAKVKSSDVKNQTPAFKTAIAEHLSSLAPAFAPEFQVAFGKAIDILGGVKPTEPEAAKPAEDPLEAAEKIMKDYFDHADWYWQGAKNYGAAQVTLADVKNKTPTFYAAVVEGLKETAKTLKPGAKAAIQKAIDVLEAGKSKTLATAEDPAFKTLAEANNYANELGPDVQAAFVQALNATNKKLPHAVNYIKLDETSKNLAVIAIETPDAELKSKLLKMINGLYAGSKALKKAGDTGYYSPSAEAEPTPAKKPANPTGHAIADPASGLAYEIATNAFKGAKSDAQSAWEMDQPVNAEIAKIANLKISEAAGAVPLTGVGSLSEPELNQLQKIYEQLNAIEGGTFESAAAPAPKTYKHVTSALNKFVAVSYKGKKHIQEQIQTLYEAAFKDKGAFPVVSKTAEFKTELVKWLHNVAQQNGSSDLAKDFSKFAETIDTSEGDGTVEEPKPEFKPTLSFEDMIPAPQREYTFAKNAGGGTKPKEIWTDEEGKEYLFKPVKKGDEFVAYGEVAGGHISALVNPKAPKIWLQELNGRTGSMQEMLPNGGDLGDVAIEDLTGAEVQSIMREHVVDWLISNHDGHRRQFLIMGDGSLVGIDKGQAFKYFGKDKLDVDYHPNSQYGEEEPIYNKMWRALVAGKLTKATKDILGPDGDTEAVKKQLGELRAKLAEIAPEAEKAQSWLVNFQNGLKSEVRLLTDATNDAEYEDAQDMHMALNARLSSIEEEFLQDAEEKLKLEPQEWWIAGEQKGRSFFASKDNKQARIGASYNQFIPVLAKTWFLPQNGITLKEAQEILGKTHLHAGSFLETHGYSQEAEKYATALRDKGYDHIKLSDDAIVGLIAPQVVQPWEPITQEYRDKVHVAANGYLGDLLRSMARNLRNPEARKLLIRQAEKFEKAKGELLWNNDILPELEQSIDSTVLVGWRVSINNLINDRYAALTQKAETQTDSGNFWSDLVSRTQYNLRTNLYNFGVKAQSLHPAEGEYSQGQVDELKKSKFATEFQISELENQNDTVKFDSIFFKAANEAVDILQNKLSDDNFLGLIKPYAERRFKGRPNNLDAFLDYALQRKGNLANKFNRFFLGLRTDQKRRSDAVREVTSSSDYTVKEWKTTVADINKTHGINLTPEEYGAINAYTGSSFRGVNNTLRTGTPWEAEKKLSNEWLRDMNFADLIESGLQKIKPYTGTAWRGQVVHSDELARLLPGRVLTNKAFWSTSYSPGNAFNGNVKFIIESKSGRNIKFLSGHASEDEVLFPTERQFLITYREEGTNKHGDPCTDIYLTELPEVDFNAL